MVMNVGFAWLHALFGIVTFFNSVVNWKTQNIELKNIRKNLDKKTNDDDTAVMMI